MPLCRAQPLLLVLILLLPATALADTADPVELVVDCGTRLGAIRPLHGVNSGPLEDGGLLDLSKFHRQAGFPLTRLHDVHWPNADVVDLHVVFPNPDADPALPSSYDFSRTDDYVRATLATGTRLVYRLGESIEHTPRKLHVHPPRDIEKWAAACVGIVRHYNDGWADGFRHDIRYWEIWNEPDNRPAMWTGNDEDYFRLYATTARLLKQRWPALKVGGPAVGNTGELIDGALRPAPFVAAFLDRCRRDRLPIDFFSWHVYTNDPREPASRARAVRRLLDEYGLQRTESHLNEWNYLPDNDWKPMLREGQGAARQRFYDRVGGAEGAAFVAATLIRLQDAPLDMANYFNAAGNGFGLFHPSGVPKKSFGAFVAFRRLLETPVRVQVSAGDLAACAGTDEPNKTVTLLIANAAPSARAIRCALRHFERGERNADARAWVLDASHDLDEINPTNEVVIPPHAVYVYRTTRR